MDSELPKNNVLLAVGTSIVVSVSCTWAIATHFERSTKEIIQHEVKLLHDRINAIDHKLWKQGDQK